MKELITFLLILAIWEATGPVYARPDPPPPAAATCIVGAIGIVVCGVIVYGLYRMCQHIPAPDQDPPYGAPITEVPGMGPPSYMHPLPPLWLRNQMMNARVSLEHYEADGWHADYTFVTTESQIGGFAMIAYDSNGVPLVTNDVPLVGYAGETYAPLMFTNLPPAVTSPASRIFRLHSQ